MKALLQDIAQCKLCKDKLPLEPRPIMSAHANSKILIVGQAPGIRVHNSGIPWNDPSGERLREWLQVDKNEFYNPELFGIVPMGFCYPGTGKSGDLPPMKECATTWHEKLLAQMPNVELTLLIGKYAQNYYLGKTQKKNLTETVGAFEEYLPQYLPLPHPSPRNNIWMKKNPWFLEAVLPTLRDRVANCIG